MTQPPVSPPLCEVYAGTWFTLNHLARSPQKKTDVYEVVTHDGEVIAHIKWHGPWCTYCLFPVPEIVMEAQCMLEIAGMLLQLTREQRYRNKVGNPRVKN